MRTPPNDIWCTYSTFKRNFYFQNWFEHEAVERNWHLRAIRVQPTTYSTFSPLDGYRMLNLKHIGHLKIFSTIFVSICLYFKFLHLLGSRIRILSNFYWTFHDAKLSDYFSWNLLETKKNCKHVFEVKGYFKKWKSRYLWSEIFQFLNGPWYVVLRQSDGNSNGPSKYRNSIRPFLGGKNNKKPRLFSKMTPLWARLVPSPLS